MFRFPSSEENLKENAKKRKLQESFLSSIMNNLLSVSFSLLKNSNSKLYLKLNDSNLQSNNKEIIGSDLDTINFDLNPHLKTVFARNETLEHDQLQQSMQKEAQKIANTFLLAEKTFLRQVSLLTTTTSTFSPIEKFAAELGNISALYPIIGKLSPPLNSTPGINDLTSKLQSIIPKDLRDQIMDNVPEHGLGHLNNEFWDATNELWQRYLIFLQNRTEILPPPFNETERDIRNKFLAAQDFANWTYNLPFTTWDEIDQEKRNYYDIVDIIRSNATARRDQLLDAIMQRQATFYSPISTGAEIARQNLQYAVDQRFTDLGNTIAPVTNLLMAWQSLVRTATLAATVGRTSLEICALNPICCENPSLCAPNVLPYSTSTIPSATP